MRFKKKGLFSPRSDLNPPFGPAAVNPDLDTAAQSAREYYLGGLRSAAPINTYSHLKEDQSDYGPIYVAIKVLKQQAASAQIKAYRWDEEAKEQGDEEKKTYLPRTHDICKFMRRPNRWDSGRRMIARGVEQRCLTGTWLGWLVKQRWEDDSPWADESGKPLELWTVPTGLYTSVPISPRYPEGAYRIQTWFPGPMSQIPGTWNAGGVIVRAENIFVSRDTHPLTYKEALSPLLACGAELDTINGIGAARKSILRRAPMPSGVVELDQGTSFPDGPLLNRIVQQIYQMLGGPDRAGRPAILGQGMKWKPIELQGMEIPFSESWEQMIQFVYSIYGLTKSIVGLDETTSYASLYASLKQFRLQALQPLLDDVADDFNMQVIEPYYGPDFGVEYEPAAVGDDELTEKQLSLDLQAGIRYGHEWRAIRKLPPSKDEKWNNTLIKGGEGKDQGQQPGQQEQNPQEEQQQNGAQGDKNPIEKTRPRNQAGAGSLPSRLTSMLNRNGKH